MTKQHVILVFQMSILYLDFFLVNVFSKSHCMDYIFLKDHDELYIQVPKIVSLSTLLIPHFPF